LHLNPSDGARPHRGQGGGRKRDGVQTFARHGPTPGGGWCSAAVVGADPAARRSSDAARARARIGWGERRHAAAGVAPAEESAEARTPIRGGASSLFACSLGAFAFQQQHARKPTDHGVLAAPLAPPHSRWWADGRSMPARSPVNSFPMHWSANSCPLKALGPKSISISIPNNKEIKF